MKCIQCGKGLVGRQKKYCSRVCKNTFLNANQQSYHAQQSRGRVRKLELIKQKGGQCTKCGYDHNFAALEFHHKDTDAKAFQLDLRSLSNRKWESIIIASDAHRGNGRFPSRIRFNNPPWKRGIKGVVKSNM